MGTADTELMKYLSDTFLVGFPKLGLLFSINPVAFTVFGFEIRWYGIIIAAGMLLAMLYCFRRMDEFGLDSDRAVDVVVGGVIGAIIGARLYYVAFDADVTMADFFKIREGGLAVYGGLIGAILVGAVVAKFRKVKFIPLLDVASMGFFIGQAIGRWGNFVNKEAFGTPTDLPWGMTSASIIMQSGGNELTTVHPCFLYESICCIIGLIIVHFYHKHRKFDGEIFLLYTAIYGFSRFFIEGLRTDSLYIGNLRVSQALAGVLCVVAVAVILIVRSKIKHSPDKVTLYRDTEESKELLLAAKARLADDERKRAEKLAKKAEKSVKQAESDVKDAKQAEKSAEKAETALEKHIEKTTEKENEDNGKDN